MTALIVPLALIAGVRVAKSEDSDDAGAQSEDVLLINQPLNPCTYSMVEYFTRACGFGLNLVIADRLLDGQRRKVRGWSRRLFIFIQEFMFVCHAGLAEYDHLMRWVQAPEAAYDDGKVHSGWLVPRVDLFIRLAALRRR